MKIEVYLNQKSVGHAIGQLKAYRDVKRARNYPSHYAEAWIENDMLNYYTNIEAVARYDYNKVGAEGQSSYSADGTRIDYIKRDSLFNGVYPISR